MLLNQISHLANKVSKELLSLPFHIHFALKSTLLLFSRLRITFRTSPLISAIELNCTTKEFLFLMNLTLKKRSTIFLAKGEGSAFCSFTFLASTGSKYAQKLLVIKILF